MDEEQQFLIVSPLTSLQAYYSHIGIGGVYLFVLHGFTTALHENACVCGGGGIRPFYLDKNDHTYFCNL